MTIHRVAFRASKSLLFIEKRPAARDIPFVSEGMLAVRIEIICCLTGSRKMQAHLKREHQWENREISNQSFQLAGKSAEFFRGGSSP